MTSLSTHRILPEENNEDNHDTTKVGSEIDFNKTAEKQLKYLSKLIDVLLKFDCFHEPKNRGRFMLL